MKRGSFFIKIVSLFLSVIFVYQETGWAQVEGPVLPEAKVYDTDRINSGGIDIPYDVASTKEMVSTGAGETIIHIQDAHASLSAQYSIAKLLDSLVTNYELSFIALEGARGFVDTSILKSFPDKKIRDNTADFLMRKGMMSAGEFFSITRDEKEVSLYGVENEELYRKNIDSFRKNAAKRALRVQNINSLLEELENMEKAVYPEGLYDLVQCSEDHREGKISFTEYWKKIQLAAEKTRVSGAGFTELPKLLKSIELEKNIDFDKANSERRALIDELSGVLGKDELEGLVLKSLEFKENKTSQEDFHKYLLSAAENNGVDLKRYENLVNFSSYIALYASVELVELYREIEKFEEDIRGALYGKSEEKSLYGMACFIRLLKKLYSMELTNDGYFKVKETREAWEGARCASFMKTLCLKYGVSLKGGYDLGAVFGGIQEALDFYLEAEARNSALLENTLARMR
ncbi:MAG: hypothetical protein ABH883_00435, partial [Candidatus Omnitrophota bacterium]